MPVEKLNVETGSEGDTDSTLGFLSDENRSTLPGDKNDLDDSDDEEMDEENLVMKGGGVDGGVSSPSEDGDVDPESLDANDTSDGVREIIERDRPDAGACLESKETLAMLSGSGDVVGSAGRGAGFDMVETRFVGRGTTFLLRRAGDGLCIGEMAIERVGLSDCSSSKEAFDKEACDAQGDDVGVEVDVI